MFFLSFKVDRDLMWLCINVEIQWKLKCRSRLFSFYYYFILWKRHFEIQLKWNILIEFFYMEMHVGMWWKRRCRDWFFFFYNGNGCWKSNRKWDIVSDFFMYAYCNSIENRIRRLIFFLMKIHAKSNKVWSIEWKK